MRTRCAFAALLGFAALATAATPASTPTPGPATRAAGAIDRAIGTVRDEVADGLLAARVRIALLQHLGQDGLRVAIEATDGVVTLSGEVAKRSSQTLAASVARSVSGVRGVRTRVAVSAGRVGGGPVAKAVGKAERGVGDAILEARLKARLLEELGKTGFAVEVEATDGVVSLSGTVPDAAREELVVKVARETTGVREVHDLLKVGKPAE